MATSRSTARATLISAITATVFATACSFEHKGSIFSFRHIEEDQDAEPVDAQVGDDASDAGQAEPTSQDQDGDGVVDYNDDCIDIPEDLDGLLDADGCPELDADGDGISDPADECPTEDSGGDPSGCPADCVATGPTELCNGVDDNCDGEIDEGFQLGQACVSDVNGCIQLGTYSCTQLGTSECAVPPPVIAAEVCNGVDDDCDGMIDEGTLNACGLCGPDLEEICDGIDQDCDGTIDDAPGGGSVCD